MPRMSEALYQEKIEREIRIANLLDKLEGEYLYKKKLFDEEWVADNVPLALQDEFKERLQWLY